MEESTSVNKVLESMSWEACNPQLGTGVKSRARGLRVTTALILGRKTVCPWSPNLSAPQIPSPRMAPSFFNHPEPLNPIFPAGIRLSQSQCQNVLRKHPKQPNLQLTLAHIYLHASQVCEALTNWMSPNHYMCFRDKGTHILFGDLLESAFYHCKTWNK